jgi:hypothetical protein
MLDVEGMLLVFVYEIIFAGFFLRSPDKTKMNFLTPLHVRLFSA